MTRLTGTAKAATAAVALTGLLGWCAATDATARSAAGDSTTLAGNVLQNAVAAPAGHSPAGAAAALATLAQRDVDAGAPGVAIRIDDGRHRPVAIAKQATWTRADHRLSAEDQFRMGSNTKTMVATVVLQLVAERRLRLTDPVDKWLPGAVANGRTTTVRMLLNHTSGLPDYGLGLMRYASPCGTVWGHTGGIPGFGSQNYADATGRKTVTVVTTTQFGAKFPEVRDADERVVDAAVCTMLGRPIPVG